MKNFKLEDNKKFIVIGIIGLIIFITILSSFQTIRSGEVGLRVRFGKIIDSNLKEGFNLKVPYNALSYIKFSLEYYSEKAESYLIYCDQEILYFILIMNIYHRIILLKFLLQKMKLIIYFY